MPEPARDVAERAVELGVRHGAGTVEATVSIDRRFHVEARGEVVTRLERSTAKALHVRAFVDGRKASLITSDFSPESLSDGVRQAIAAAAYVARDELAGLPESFATTLPDLELLDPAIAERDDAGKVEEALQLERWIRDADARILNSNGSHYSDATSEIAIANSAQFSGSYRSTRASRSSGPVAVDGAYKRTGHYGTAARRLSELESLESVARKAVSRAVEMFGARKPPTMRAPVIFERDVAASILDDVFAALSGANVAAGNSWLIGRIGQRIAADSVTIVDDGRLAGRLGSSPFDGEGVATQRTPVIENGYLTTFLCDTYYARRLGTRSTGNSSGSGVGSNNFFLETRGASLQDAIAATKRGVLVLDTIGFATEHASGTYSRGARGFLVENGEKLYPIDEFTIAGGYLEMLAAIDVIGDDLRFDGAVTSPSFRVAEMTVSGN
ncbi:MAG TPA: TldD/PmbA family protein [Candidatus Tumulicola sp.]|jgi:PmbA protein